MYISVCVCWYTQVLAHPKYSSTAYTLAPHEYKSPLKLATYTSTIYTTSCIYTAFLGVAILVCAIIRASKLLVNRTQNIKCMKT